MGTDPGSRQRLVDELPCREIGHTVPSSNTALGELGGVSEDIYRACKAKGRQLGPSVLLMTPNE